MKKEEYLAKHIIINDYINKKNVDGNEFDNLSSTFEDFNSEQKIFITREIMKEIIILFKARGIKAKVFKTVIDNFSSDLWLYEIFGDKIFDKKINIDPVVERIK